MNGFKLLGASLAIFAVLSPPVGAAEYTGPGFAADMYFAEKDGALEPMGRIYMGKTAMRFESGGAIVLVFLKTRKVVSLMPEQKMYMELPAATSPIPEYQDKPCVNYQNSEKLGSETINGRKAGKWRCTGQIYATGGESADTTNWFDDKLKFWLRDLRDSGEVTELRNIAVGKQPDSLFVIPDGYQQFNMVTGQQMMQQQQARQDGSMGQMNEQQRQQQEHELEMQRQEQAAEILRLLQEQE
ncbi:MAG: hypothetical protein V3S44_02660 [Alphaproteobacteria bacterium]